MEVQDDDDDINPEDMPPPMPTFGGLSRVVSTYKIPQKVALARSNNSVNYTFLGRTESYMP